MSKQPELKHAAVRIEKLDLPWRFVAFGWVAARDVARVLADWRDRFDRFAYASAVPFGRVDCASNDDARVGVLFRGAHAAPFDDGAVAAIESAFGLDAPDALRYDDARRGHARRVRVTDGALAAVSLRGDWTAETWLKSWLEEGAPVGTLGRLLLKPGAAAPTGFASRGRVICNCIDVSEREIVDALATMTGGDGTSRVATLQATLKCGTECGSCVPELKRMALAA